MSVFEQWLASGDERNRLEAALGRFDIEWPDATDDERSDALRDHVMSRMMLATPYWLQPCLNRVVDSVGWCSVLIRLDSEPA